MVFIRQLDGDASGRSKQSRSEKKSRKAMLKLGMKPITGVSRVTVKKRTTRRFPSDAKSMQSDWFINVSARDITCRSGRGKSRRQLRLSRPQMTG
ncbi:hypothetical protein V2J09_005514 [Rumex salicifolius]